MPPKTVKIARAGQKAKRARVCFEVEKSLKERALNMRDMLKKAEAGGAPLFIVRMMD